MKQIPNQTSKDLIRILPILADLARGSTDIRVLNAERQARKITKQLSKNQ